MESSASRSCSSSFVLVATFLTLSALTGTAESQRQQPQVQLVTQPQPRYHVSRNEPANVTCEAYGATDVTFSCLGEPAPAWAQSTYKAFDEGRGNTLVRGTLRVSWEEVEEAREEGEEYWCDCTARDEDSFVSVSSRRAVISPAFLKRKFQEVPVSQIVATGSQTVFTCTPPLGEPEPEVTWRKDGRRLNVAKDDNLVLGADTSLTIMAATTEDMGMYTCVAKNMAGWRESPAATLTLQGWEEAEDEWEEEEELMTRADKDTAKPRAQRAVDSPVFNEEPQQNIYITPNQPVPITCDVEGAELMTFRCNNLRVDGTKLQTQHDRTAKHIRSTMILSYAEVENYLNSYREENYECQCVAWFTDPSAQTPTWKSKNSQLGSIYLAYLDEDFLEEPGNGKGQAGRSVSMSCGAPDGQPEPRVSWVFNQQRLDPRVDRRYTVSEDGTLTISNLDYRDEGQYFCIAENAIGIRQSAAGFLSVTGVRRTTVVDDPVIETTEAPRMTTPKAKEGAYTPTFPSVIPESPTFTHDLQKKYFLDQAGEATLVCTVVSADMLTYRCNNVRLQENQQVINVQASRESSKRLLTATTVVTTDDVTNSQMDDYSCQCVAWFIEDEAWQYIVSTMAVVVPSYIDSVFTYEPQGGVFRYGDTAEFACHPPGGQPAPQVMWLKDGQQLDPAADNNFEILQGGGLIVGRVRAQDAGEYVCVAANLAGRRESSPAVLEVYGAPDTTSTEAPVTYPTTPSPTTEVDGMDRMTSSTLHPDALEFSTSKSGRNIPIIILTSEAEVYVIRDEPARLMCQALEATMLVFVCNSERVPAAREIDAFKTVDPATGYTFLEKSVAITRQDLERVEAGKDYVCQCRAYYPGEPGEEGDSNWQYVGAEETKVKLSFMEYAFQVQPLPQFVQLGVTTELVCQPPMGVPKPTVYWLKDGYRVEETNHIRVNSEGSLVFDKVSLQDSGNYTCAAVNLIDTRQSNTVPLSVIEDSGEGEAEGEAEGEPEEEGEPEGEAEGEQGVPHFMAEPEAEYYIIRSRPVTITCQVTGAEQINFNCNSESISQSRVQYEDLEVEGHEDVMTASIDISREEVENYNNQHWGNDFHCQCLARYTSDLSSDPQYVASSKGYVQVAYLKKMFKREPFNITVDEGEFVSLPCDAPEGNPTPEVYWTFNGERQELDVNIPDNAFVISAARAEDAGTYICVASNVANTRRSRPGSVSVNVNGILITGPQQEGQPEPESELGTTTSDYEDTTTESNPIQKCVQILRSCTAIMPQGSQDADRCKNAPRYIACVEEFLTECEEVLNAEALEAAQSAKKMVETSCGSEKGTVCQELLACQSQYSDQTVPSADATTMPMTVLCAGIHTFLKCAHDAAIACKIPQDNPDTSLDDLAGLFEDYCQKVVEKPWASNCDSFSRCDLPIAQTTILSNLVQASLWCPYVSDTMECTRQALSDCGETGLDDEITSVEMMAKDTCPASSETESEGEPEGEGEAEGEKEKGDVGKTVDEESEGDAGGHASGARGSVLLMSLLAVMLAWMTWR